MRWFAGFLITELLLSTVGGIALNRDLALVWAQEPLETVSIGDAIDVDIVNLEIFVQDRQGNPVKGLKKDDFTLMIGGRPQEISNFYAAENTGPGTTAPAPQSLINNAVEETAAQATLPLADQRLHLVIFWDDLNTRTEKRQRIFADLRRFLRDGLQAGIRVMLVRYNGRLQVEQELTNDTAALLASLARIEEEAARGAEWSMDRDGILRQIAQAQLPVQGSTISNESFSIAISEARAIHSAIQLMADRRHQEVIRTILTLEQLSNAMAGLPGRKALLYVGEGLEHRAGEEIYMAWEQKFSALRDYGPEDGASTTEINKLTSMDSSVGVSSAQFDATRALRRFGEQANAHQVTFHALRAAGGELKVSAEEGTFDLGALDTASGGETWSTGLHVRQAANRGSSLQLLSDMTGGMATINASAFEVALGRLGENFGTYYSLGFPAVAAGDGTQKIRVKVDGPWKVRHRKSFQQKSNDQKMVDLTFAALALETEINPLQVLAQVEPAHRTKKAQVELPIMVKVPLANVVLIPRQGEYHGEVSIFVIAMDKRGRVSPIRKQRVPIRIPEEQFKEALEQVAGVRIPLLLRAVDHSIAVGVRDENGQVESTTRVDFALDNTDALVSSLSG